MMMTCPVVLATASWMLRSTSAFTLSRSFRPSRANNTSRLFASASSDVMAAVLKGGISRLSTLQTLLSKYGAPGSQGCLKGSGDLKPIAAFEGPELVGSLVGDGDQELLNLHPHLFPITKSETTGNYICALRRAYAGDTSYETSTDSPWPIVEAQSGGPGMRLLSLNSENLMRRIACHGDFEGSEDLVTIYNDGLGKGLVNDKTLDSPYVVGSAEQLGYGVEKYILLRVGPFPDLYEQMATGHATRGDEQSALIASETSNRKFSGFGSTFRFQARMLASLPGRQEEARDAARMCLRMPLPSIGLTLDDFCEVAVLAQVADENDSTEVKMEKLSEMYEKLRKHEQEEDGPSIVGQQGMTPEQKAIDEANHLLDTTALSGGGKWSEVRAKLAEIYGSVERDDMANFVNPNVM